MDGVILRLPCIAQQIFEKLDDQSLTNCKIINQNWRTFLEETRFLWIRIVQRNIKIVSNVEFEKFWELLLKKESTEFLKKIASMVEEFFTELSSRRKHQWTPLHIAAFYGNIKIYRYISAKIGNKSLKNDNGVTPLHIAGKTPSNRNFSYFLQQGLE